MNHEKFQECISVCYECAAACDVCASSCLREEMQAMKRCIELDIYCADICRLAAAFMAKGSSYSGLICRICAEICEECGRECEKHSADHCRRCAEVCLRCTEECRRMAA